MKRLFLILLIIFSLPAMAQYDVFGQYNNPFSVWGSKTKTPAGGNYVQRAWDFFNAVTAKGKTLTDAQKRWYNDSIFVPGIAHGYIGTTRAGDSLVALYSFSLRWAGDSTVANMNLLDPTGSYNCIHYGGVTYTDSGVVGDGATGYLNTFFNPVADSSIYKNLSAGVFVYSLINIMGLYSDIANTGATSGTILLIHYNDKVYGNVNTKTDAFITNNSSLGFFQTIRQSYNYVLSNINGTVTPFTTGGDGTATGLQNDCFLIGADNNAGILRWFSPRCYPFAGITSGLSAGKSQYLSDDLNNALKGAGYNVY